MKTITTNTTISVLILLVAFCSWAGIGFVLKKLYSARMTYEKTRQDLGTLQAQALAATRARALVRNSASERQELNAAIPQDLVSGINRTVALVNADEMSVLVDIATEDMSVKPPLQAALITLSGNGSFKDVLRAVARVEALPTPVTLRDFTIEYGVGGSQKAPWHISIKSTVFAFAEASSTSATSTTP